MLLERHLRRRRLEWKVELSVGFGATGGELDLRRCLVAIFLAEELEVDELAEAIEELLALLTVDLV